MTDRSTPPLPPGLEAIQRRWRDLPRREQDLLYATEFAEPFAPLFADRPLAGAPDDLPRPRFLVSLLGLSWQPVSLMAAWCKPERMLVIGTEVSLDLTVGGEDVLSLIARIAGIPRGAIEPARVGDPGEAEIYRHVRDFIQGTGVPPREVFIDPTGGKKSMSAAAALAGYVLGAPLVYVDYADYHGSHRIPIAGTEFPRLLVNPLEVMGDLELRDVFRAFDRSDFQEAERLAARLARRLYEPREAECLAFLARGYGAWDGFRFAEAREAFGDARGLLERYADQGRWRWAPAIREGLGRNLRALDALARIEEKSARLEDGIPLLAWYLAAAERLLGAGKVSLAVLLTYAAIERHVGLCLWVDFGLDPATPDYARIAERLDRKAYCAAGRHLLGKDYEPRDPSGPLMFATGAQLLAALSPERLNQGDLGFLRGLSITRNRCEYEHGFLPRPPERSNAKSFLPRARDIIARACEDAGVLEARIEDCRFPKLEVE